MPKLYCAPATLMLHGRKATTDACEFDLRAGWIRHHVVEVHAAHDPEVRGRAVLSVTHSPYTLRPPKVPEGGTLVLVRPRLWRPLQWVGALVGLGLLYKGVTELFVGTSVNPP